MNKWTIEVEHARAGYTWTARSDEGEYLSHNFWDNSTFISEKSAVAEAMREIALYEVLETKTEDEENPIYGPSKYRFATNG